VRAGRAGQPDDRGVRAGFIPVVHRLEEGSFRFVGGRDFRFLNRPHRPIALFHVRGLRTLEGVDGPKDGQPAIGVRRGKAGQVSRIDDENRVELEAHGTRLNVAHARQQKRGDDLAISRAAPNARSDFL
jgi:hypothetical protein